MSILIGEKPARLQLDTGSDITVINQQLWKQLGKPHLNPSKVEIEAKSRPLLTIYTHRGLYHYNRLPPGIKVAPGAFQQIMDKMLAGVNGVSAYMDDVIVGGKTQEEHDAALEETLKRIRDYGFTIRSEKCAFNKSEIRYLGHIIDSRGLRPDPAKIDAIKNLPAPKDVTGVRSFIGAINVYAKFIPNMRNLRYPLDKLLLAGSVFQWTPECQKAFDQFKALLSTELLLTHYDPTRDIVVSADASSVGLGATLCHKYPDGSLKVLHKGHPGMQRMKAIARSFLYWPMIDDDIVSYVASCGSCLVAAKAPPRATPATWPTPSGAWRRVHVDYAGPLEGYYFLVVVDAFSKWPEFYKTTSTTTSATISMLRNIFARFGMPETLVSDNGPQFTSALFAEFCNSSGIEHITTAPFHPQSNGQAKRFVDTLKRALRKIQSDETSLDETLELFLMTYRSTPNAQLSQQKSPAQEMFGCPIRTALELLRPTSSHSLSPSSFISKLMEVDTGKDRS
uniref:uncharacterized protein K02A2.6-like n=1 Tax=Anopheles coluzzii TaxID=1518534 RepID=UPI0020FFDFB8|nr:uncharacterized protein K02A2.6-like [Anopheles coluzzii]